MGDQPLTTATMWPQGPRHPDPAVRPWTWQRKSTWRSGSGGVIGLSLLIRARRIAPLTRRRPPATATAPQCREARVRCRVSAAGSTSSSRRSLPRGGSDILFDRLEAETLSWRALAPRARDQGVEPGVGGDEQVLAFLARQQAEQRNRPAPPRQDDGAPRRLPGVLREGSGRSRQFNPRHDRSISTPPTNTRSLTLTPIARIVTQGSGVSLTSSYTRRPPTRSTHGARALGRRGLRLRVRTSG